MFGIDDPFTYVKPLFEYKEILAIYKVNFLNILDSQSKSVGWVTHSVSRFDFNARVLVDASSNPPVSVSNCCNKKLASSKQAKITSSINQSNDNSIK